MVQNLPFSVKSVTVVKICILQIKNLWKYTLQRDQKSKSKLAHYEIDVIVILKPFLICINMYINFKLIHFNIFLEYKLEPIKYKKHMTVWVFKV